MSNEEHAKKFGALVRDRRKALGFTVEQAAKRIGISKQYLSVIERASPQAITGQVTIPSREVVAKIARALEIPENVAFKEAGYTAVSEDHDILNGVVLMFQDHNRLTPEQKQKILDAVKLIAAGVVSEQVGEWLRNAPPLDHKNK